MKSCVFWQVVFESDKEEFSLFRVKRFAVTGRDLLKSVFSERQQCYVRYMPSQFRLFVCRLSVTLVHPTQPVEIFGIFFTIRQSMDSSFLMPKFVGGDAPFPLKFASKATHPLSNSKISTNIGS